MKIRKLQSAFVAGEITEDMWGRSDLATYQSAAAKLRNVYVLPQGGCFRREGLCYVDSTTTNQAGRLIPFEFNSEQKYMFVFTPGEFKVYKDRVLQATVTSSPISNLTAAIIDEMNFTQSADTLILVHPDIQPIKITRSSHTSWSAANLSLSNIPQYNYGSGNEAVISATRGWVRAIGFKYGRLWLCGLKSRPQTILASKVGSFFDLNEGTGLDDEGINITIDDDRVNAIRSVFPGRTLQIFTTGGEFTIQAAPGDPVTPGKIAEQLKKATLHGCNRVRPVSVDGASIFVEGSGYVVRQFIFNDLEQSYNAPNISILSAHLVREPRRMDVRRSVKDYPADYVYLVNTDGTMAVLNVLRAEKLLAWTLFETDGLIEDIAVIGEEAYCIVNRTINGASVRFVEVLDPDHFLDASLIQTSGTAETAWTGLDHLDGEELRVRGDDFILANATPTSGEIESSEAVETLEAGLFFAPIVKPLPVDVQIAGQNYIGEYKRLVSVNIRMVDTRGLIVEDDARTYRPAFRKLGGTLLDQPVPLYSGWKRVFLGGVKQDSNLTITQDEPLEFKIIALQITIGI